MSEILFNQRLIDFNAKHAGKKYWTAKLQGRKELLFPADGAVETREFALDAELYARLAKICSEPQALLVLLTAALGVQLYKVLDETTVTIGTAPSLPLVFDVTPDASFREVLNAAKQTYIEAQANQDYPVDLLLKSFEDDAKMFNVGISLNNALSCDAQLIFNFEQRGEQLVCTITGTDVERTFNNYQFILSNCLQSPDKKIKEIEAVLPAEKHAILHEFNATSAPYPRNASIIEIFEEQVKLRPDSTALIYNEQRLTYAALNDKANALAGRLLAAGAQPQMNIAVFQRMDIHYIVAILAILKVRCAYVPISTQDPLARIAWLLDEIKASIVLSTRASIAESGIEAEMPSLIYADEDHNEPFAASAKPSHSDIAYIMFTSGSTGNPKGVMVTHRNVLRLVCNTNYVNFSPDTRILLTGAPGFDATTFEIWGSLLNGGVLTLADKDALLDVELLHQELTRNNINTVWLTSAFFNQVVQQSRRNIFAGMSYLLVGGDILSPKHINKVRKDNPSLKIVNGYGPTENTTFSLTMTIDQEYKQSIPIGRPINNSTAYVLDRDLNIKPAGAWGILYVGGDGVSAGYLNSPELTAEKFIQNPFGPGLLYRTDDVARLLPGLTVEFKGRIDDQVKIRGFRITLGEIEHQLCKHELVAESVVLVKAENGDKQLVAYYVSRTEISAAELKAFLLASLPDYMVPAYYVHLDSMPLTANGKVNKKLLPAVQQNAANYEPPADEVEAQLAAIWSQLFQVDTSLVSVTANFFDLGGHSLKATALMNNINRAFDTHILIKDIFSAPTIREQSAFIKMNKWASANKEYDNEEGIEIVV